MKEDKKEEDEKGEKEVGEDDDEFGKNEQKYTDARSSMVFVHVLLPVGKDVVEVVAEKLLSIDALFEVGVYIVERQCWIFQAAVVYDVREVEEVEKAVMYVVNGDVLVPAEVDAVAGTGEECC